jgi:hypothetical protein
MGGEGIVITDIESTGSPFATALAVRVLACAAASGVADDYQRELMSRALQGLIEMQQPNGAWRPSARLRVPPPDLGDPDPFINWGRDGRGEKSIGTIVCDRTAVHTTATVLRALVAVEQLKEVRLVDPDFAKNDALR